MSFSEVLKPKVTGSNKLLSYIYCPHTLDEFGLDMATHGALRSLLAMNSLNVLLYGNPSSGKTTLVDVLVHEYYSVTNQTSSVSSVGQIMHINSLKEQGVRFYRTEMKAFCRSVSAIPGKKKLVIIDDLDSVPEQSQQVFRDYIDKYSCNVCFIATCTNLQRVIESIQSRVHLLRLRSLPNVQIDALINRICLEQQIPLSIKGKAQIIAASNGSVRAAINSLEKLRILGVHMLTNDYTKLEDGLDAGPMCELTVFFSFLLSGIDGDDTTPLCNAILTLFTLYDLGYSVIDILDFVYQFIKTTTMFDERIKYKMIPVLCEYIIIIHDLHEDKIELALLTNRLLECIHENSNCALMY